MKNKVFEVYWYSWSNQKTGRQEHLQRLCFLCQIHISIWHKIQSGRWCGITQLSLLYKNHRQLRVATSISTNNFNLEFSLFFYYCLRKSIFETLNASVNVNVYSVFTSVKLNQNTMGSSYRSIVSKAFSSLSSSNKVSVFQ